MTITTVSIVLEYHKLDCKPTFLVDLILVIRHGTHTNARGLPTSRKHMTIGNDVLDYHCFQLYLSMLHEGMCFKVTETCIEN